VLLGQDPYHRPGQAHGLSFSVRPGVRVPPSLRNVFKELAADLGAAAPATGDLTGWAAQGVLLLNAVLTVREGAAGSHAGKGWEAFTDATIRALNDRDERIVFLLWGGYARRKADLVTNPVHVVLEAGHPSPLNTRGFLGCRPFSAANKALADAGRTPVEWSLPAAG
jgi:uracil-DNA glycosylase